MIFVCGDLTTGLPCLDNFDFTLAIALLQDLVCGALAAKAPVVRVKEVQAKIAPETRDMVFIVIGSHKIIIHHYSEHRSHSGN